MERFRLGHAADADWRRGCEDCLRQLAPLPAGANLGFLYLSAHFARAAADILARLRGATGIEHWVGTSGMGVCATGREYFDQPAMVVLAAALPQGAFRLFDLDERGVDGYVSANRAWLERTGAPFGVAHGDPRAAATLRLLPRFAEATNAFLVGGLTSSQDEFPQFAGGLAKGLLSGVLFSSDIVVATALSQGCAPLGPAHEVTECAQNIAISLDGRPALEVLKEEIGEVLARDLRRLAGAVFAALPVEGSDRADYVVRNLVGFDVQAGVVAIADELRQGQRLMFCRRDPEAAREDMGRMLSDLKRRAKGAPRGALYCSCVARGPNMFGPDSGELDAIRSALGEVPLAGFFGNGEFCHNRLYTYTGVLALFL